MGYAPEVGTIYLLHFERPYRHAKHYLGWTSELDERLIQHQSGRGARLVAVITNAGIGFSVSRTWRGTRHKERRLCPTCRPGTKAGLFEKR